MSFTLTNEEREGYIYFHVEGRDSLEVSKAYFSEVFRQAAELGYKKILIDEALEGGLNTIEMYDLTEMISSVENKALLKVAFVDHDAKNATDQEFGVTVVRNRGMNAKRFSSVEEARDWLLSK